MRCLVQVGVVVAALVLGTSPAFEEEGKREWKALSKRGNASGYDISLLEVVRSDTYPLGSCPPGIVGDQLHMPGEEAVVVHVAIRPTAQCIKGDVGSNANSY
jgi:hypothetical protein